MMEHLVGQEILGLHFNVLDQLSFWVREKKGPVAEIDYLINLDGHLVPIEVKSGATDTLKSLHLVISRHRMIWPSAMNITQKPKRNLLHWCALLSFGNSVMTMAATPASGQRKTSMLNLNPIEATTQLSSVAPMSAPKIMASAFCMGITPAPTNANTIRFTTELLCSTPVTMAPPVMAFQLIVCLMTNENFKS